LYMQFTVFSFTLTCYITTVHFQYWCK